MECPFAVGPAIVMDELEHYYAFGNTPPSQIVPRGVRSPRILCLAAGDVRSCLFSISRSDIKDVDQVTFVLNDGNAAIVARNVVLLVLALQPQDFGCLPGDLWDIWYSLFISPRQWNCVSKLLTVLINANSASALLQRLNISFTNETSAVRCTEVWTMWQQMEVNPRAAETLRDEYLCQKHRCRRNSLGASFAKDLQRHCIRQGYIGGAFLFPDGPFPLPGLHQNSAGLQRYLSNLDLGEQFLPKSAENEALVVNSTLFMDEKRYNLHYGTAYYQSYPLWKFNPQNETLEQFCRSQLAEWAEDFQLFSDKIAIDLTHGDCLSVCVESPHWCKSFDLIDTSNVADYVGLASLLLVCEPLIKDSGVLCTSSMTFAANACGEKQYLQQQLAHDKELWPVLYGWRCQGDMHGVNSLNTEWPLVSHLATIRFRWSPAEECQNKCVPTNDQVLAGLRKHILPDCPSGFQVGCSTGVGVLFLVRNTREPRQFLYQWASEIPKEKIDELKLWASLLTSSCRPQDKGTFVEFETLGQNGCFKNSSYVRQPLLKLNALHNGNVAIFECISLGKKATGATAMGKTFIPSDLDLATVTIVNANGLHHEFPFTVKISSIIPSLDTVRTTVASSRPHNRQERKVKLLRDTKRFPLYSLQRYCTLTPNRMSKAIPFEGTGGQQVLAAAASEVLLKTELLVTRSGAPGRVSDADPFLSIKEFIMSLMRDKVRRSLMYGGDGTGVVPIVIVKEGLYQDELLGTPVIDMLVFFPTKPFPAEQVPYQLQQHHAGSDAKFTVILSSNTRAHFRQIVALLSYEDFEMTTLWGMQGLYKRCNFPALFPTRRESMAQKGAHLNLIATLGVLRHTSENAREYMKALKDRGNDLLKEGKLQEAILCYTLAALKLESEGVNEDDPIVRELAAQCHCNLALVYTRIGDTGALVAGVRSCGMAIYLMPNWGKPYFRRGMCREKQGLRTLALQDFRTAMRHCPNDRAVAQALLRLKQTVKADASTSK